MSRYIDVDLATDEIIKDMCGVPDIDEGLSTAISELRLMPTADVVEVVRCKDCKYADFDQYDKTEEFDVFCFHFSMGFMRRCDFCSWGERRENGEIH